MSEATFFMLKSLLFMLLVVITTHTTTSTTAAANPCEVAVIGPKPIEGNSTEATNSNILKESQLQRNTEGWQLPNGVEKSVELAQDFQDLSNENEVAQTPTETQVAFSLQGVAESEVRHDLLVRVAQQQYNSGKQQYAHKGNRVKRQPPGNGNNDVMAQDLQLQLPIVPLPAPPPFPISKFAGGALNAFAFGAHGGQAATASSVRQGHVTPTCGGILKSRHGVVQTPNFPRKFQTPIECVWIIDASELPTPTANINNNHNISIVVYLAQLYVLGGLKFTEYMYYSDDYKVPAHRVFTLTEDDVTQVAWVQFNSQYLEIRFTMASLDGTHLRALDRLLDVYGFNITYEVQDRVKPYQCNTLQCRFLGHCYASAEFSHYYCACFAGFSGVDCGRGPLCEDPHTNICQNGGTCKHIGDAAITCHCPAGFKGTKCEIPEINERTMGCTSNASLSDCHRDCDFEGFYNSGISMLKASRNSARSGKTRYEVSIRLGANLTAFYRQNDAASMERRPGDHLPSLLERHLMRVLRNFNITRISDLELISNSTDRLDITFHFFGVKGDSNRIREAITRMVERGRIGNITLVSNYNQFDENPPLNLMDMFVNQKSAIRENSEFIISCTAQGSARMQFQWFKDGAIVNASKATREIWTTVLPPETKDVFTAILGVTKANRMDEGVYTCKVTDWGVEQCRSLHVHIKTPPRLRVDPASVTLHRGDSLRVRCLSPGNDDIKRYAQLGYSWTRNGVLFQADPATVMWEDLYPDGSILKINNIQKSAEYSCMVSNTVRPVSKSVYITVIDRNAVHVCHAETLYGVRWPTSAPGAAIHSDCPRGFEGQARRVCEKRDAGNSSWLTPDFALCVREQLLLIHNEFRALSAGFQQTNSSAILKACWTYTIHRHKQFLPGEASFLINMLHEVDTYLQLKGTQLEREMAAEIILHILDKVMQNAQSLNSQQQIKKLQLLTQSAALNRETIAASQLATSTSTSLAGVGISNSVSISTSQAAAGTSLQSSSDAATSSSGSSSTVRSTQADTAPVGDGSSAAAAAAAAASVGGSSGSKLAATLLKTTDNSNNNNQYGNAAASGSILTVDEDSLSLDRLNSLRIYMTSVKTLPFNLRIYGDDLFADQLYMDIGLSSRLLNLMANATIFASVISYKNLKSFLPKTYYTRGSDAKESDYVLASRIIQTWLFQSNRSNDNLREPLDLPFEAGHVEIIFQHESPPRNSDWIAVCGHDYKASFESTWRSDLCITKNIMENITHCICPLSGTYVVMLTKRHQQSTPPHAQQRPIFIIVSCAGCLLQSCSAFLILLPIWYNRKCAITFLKMQFCVSTSSIMIIFLLGFLKMLPVHWHAIISSSLASLLLLGVSTLLAIALVIHSELVPKKLLHHMSKASAATTTTTLSSKKPLLEQHEREALEKCHNFGSAVTNITQISLQGQSSTTQLRRSSNTPTRLRRGPPAGDIYLPSGARGAIGISWLLPLLYAIAAPLICSIIGKWPQNWWLQAMSTTNASSTTTPGTAGVLLENSLEFGGGMAGGGLGFGGGLGSGYFLTSQQQPQPPLRLTAAADNLWAEQATTTTTSSATSSFASTSTLLPSLATTSTAYSSIASALSASSAAWRPYNIYATTTAAATTAADVLNGYAIDDDYGDVSLAEANSLTGSASAAADSSQQQQQQQPPQLPQPQLHYQQQFEEAAAGSFGVVTTTTTTTPTFSFIIFICIDLLFVLLFVALFIILIKKLLWLWHKNRSVHAHPLDKFNIAMRRRMGLLYRSGVLLLLKLCTDALFITYVNAAPDSLWSYPFGITAMLLGFAILFCFVLKAECKLRSAADGKNGGGNASATMAGSTTSSSACIMGSGISGGILKKHTQLSASKTSLDENYCTGSINSPLSFYTAHEKEKECEGSAPLVQELPSSAQLTALPIVDLTVGGAGGVHMPLTIISTAPRCQLLTGGEQHVETYLGAGSLDRKGVLRQLGGATQPMAVSCQAAGITSPATRCCNLLSGVGGGSATLPAGVSIASYYDAYGHELSRDFVGVETLDILQGVAADSIIGIRAASGMLPAGGTAAAAAHYQQQQHHKPYMDMPNANSSSVTTQTPKTQKRVTILEPTTHTFDPLLPTMIAVSSAAVAASAAAANHMHTTTAVATISTPTPIITISCTTSTQQTTMATATTTTTAVAGTSSASTPDDENSINGMFDRITHDLDYLLNRSNDVPPTSTQTAATTNANAERLISDLAVETQQQLGSNNLPPNSKSAVITTTTTTPMTNTNNTNASASASAVSPKCEKREKL